MRLSCFISFIYLAGAQQQSMTPQVEVALVPTARAASPVPPSDARAKMQKNDIGEGMAHVAVGQPSDYWEEHIHMSEHHQPVVTNFLHDTKAGILYAYRHGDFACNHEAMHGGVLEALYTSNNSAGRQVGSGWYVAELDAGKCGAKEPGLYGCKFTGDGRYTECGSATINNQAGDIELAR